jgi:hypothetical protein
MFSCMQPLWRRSVGSNFGHSVSLTARRSTEGVLKPGQTAADAVFEEKRREDARRDLGWQIVRWIWQDLYRP